MVLEHPKRPRGPTRRGYGISRVGVSAWVLAVWCFAGAAMSEPVNAGPTNLAQLRLSLANALGQTAAPGAVWGLQVVSLANGVQVFGASTRRLFIPASCTKLFTTALALDRLGADRRIVTPLLATGNVDAAGTLHGDLLWSGKGAPDLGERRSGSQENALLPYVEAVVRAGIRRVTGGVVADESYFRTSRFGPGWNWDDLPEAYGAAISSLSFNDNIARVVVEPGVAGLPAQIRVEPNANAFRLVNHTRTGSPDLAQRLRFERLPGTDELFVLGTLPLRGASHTERLAVPDPAWVAAVALRDALQRRGIELAAGPRVLRWHDDLHPVASAQPPHWLGAVTSAPMSELVRDCLKPSQNLHAQLLLLQVGAEIEARPQAGEVAGETTDETALAGLQRFLKTLGITEAEYSLEEGSGLSRKNLVTPRATVRLLRHLGLHPDPAVRRAWMAALPVAGVDGTLKGRFTREPARGHILAKTGSLRQVQALAGYVDTLGGDRLAFALFLNGYVTPDPKASGRAEMDRVMEIIAGYPGKL